MAGNGKSLPIGVGSKSAITNLGTTLWQSVQLKNALNSGSQHRLQNVPSGYIPCSRQYNSQQALAI